MTKKGFTISEDEKKLFRDTVAHVKPIKKIDRVEKPAAQQKKIKIHYSEEKTTPYFNRTEPDITGEDIISFSKDGLQHKTFSKLKQGRLPIEATLDLHEHTSDEALQKTDQFLIRCQNRGFKTVCIIHGKGHLSADNKPILKNMLNSYLRGHPCVLAFHSAKNKQGGTGAMIVMIKSRGL